MSLQGRCIITNIDYLAVFHPDHPEHQFPGAINAHGKPVITVNQGSDHYDIVLPKVNQAQTFCAILDEICASLNEPIYLQVKPNHTECAYACDTHVIRCPVDTVEHLDNPIDHVYPYSV